MLGAVSISMDPTGEPESFYADGVEYYVINNNQGYDGDLELAMIPETFRTDILKEEQDTNNVLVENSYSETGSVALLFEFDGVVRKIRHLLYNCSASRPSIESKTNEASKEVRQKRLQLRLGRLQMDMLRPRLAIQQVKQLIIIGTKLFMNLNQTHQVRLQADTLPPIPRQQEIVRRDKKSECY